MKSFLFLIFGIVLISLVDLRGGAMERSPGLLLVKGRFPGTFIEEELHRIKAFANKVMVTFSDKRSGITFSSNPPPVYFVKPEKTHERIVGGDTIDISEAPYQVQIENRGQFICGGSVFKPNYIISAAHCFDEVRTEDVTVRAGTTYQNDGGSVIQVSEIIIPDEFNLQISYDYDIAILKLEDDLTYGENIRAIELTTSQPQQGEKATVSGWGLVNENGVPSYDLQSVTVPVQDWNICSHNYAQVMNFPLTQRMICAGDKGKDACKGDSGGPLVINGKLSGITSFGNGCGRDGYPGVYTNVVEFIDWIVSNTS